MNNVFNIFISSNALPCDERLFFDSLDTNDKICKFLPNEFTMEDMAVATGFFNSKTQARKNGWTGPVPLGFHSCKCNKKTVWWFNSMDSNCD